uniref:Uncharacterized protein n=1 Tax=Anguilla anguilla TaxID=7936 RepID=A0A0E9RPH0_ANGAN
MRPDNEWMDVILLSLYHVIQRKRMDGCHPDVSMPRDTKKMDGWMSSCCLCTM